MCDSIALGTKSEIEMRTQVLVIEAIIVCDFNFNAH